MATVYLPLCRTNHQIDAQIDIHSNKYLFYISIKYEVVNNVKYNAWMKSWIMVTRTEKGEFYKQKEDKQIRLSFDFLTGTLMKANLMNLI